MTLVTKTKRAKIDRPYEDLMKFDKPVGGPPGALVLEASQVKSEDPRKSVEPPN
jgi:hypothetical protein